MYNNVITYHVQHLSPSRFSCGKSAILCVGGGDSILFAVNYECPKCLRVTAEIKVEDVRNLCRTEFNIFIALFLDCHTFKYINNAFSACS